MHGVKAVSSMTLAALVLACDAGMAQSRDNGWVLLGQRQVNDRIDHDRVNVTASMGDFTKVKLVVQRAPVDFHRVVIHYANGSDQEVELRQTIPADGESRAIDLRGDNRVIRSVEFWYDARSARGRRAVIRLLGRP